MKRLIKVMMEEREKRHFAAYKAKDGKYYFEYSQDSDTSRKGAKLWGPFESYSDLEGYVLTSKSLSYYGSIKSAFDKKVRAVPKRAPNGSRIMFLTDKEKGSPKTGAKSEVVDGAVNRGDIIEFKLDFETSGVFVGVDKNDDAWAIHMNTDDYGDDTELELMPVWDWGFVKKGNSQSKREAEKWAKKHKGGTLRSWASMREW